MRQVGYSAVQLIIAAVILFIATVGGVWVGRNLFAKQPERVNIAAQASTGAPYVNFGPGDGFPLEQFWDTAGNSIEIQDVLTDRNSLLFFVSFDCERCLDLMELWKKNLQGKVQDNSQIVVCVDSAVKAIPTEYSGLFEKMRVLRYDAKRWQSVYHLRFFPMMALVDGSVIVNHVQLGFDDWIDHEIIEAITER